MHILINCSACNYRGTLPDDFPGSQVRCPKCNVNLSVRGGNASINKTLMGELKRPTDEVNKTILGELLPSSPQVNKTLLGELEKGPENPNKTLLGELDKSSESKNKTLLGELVPSSPLLNKTLLGEPISPSENKSKALRGEVLPPTGQQNKTLLGEVLPPTTQQNKTLLGELVPPENKGKTVLGELLPATGRGPAAAPPDPPLQQIALPASTRISHPSRPVSADRTDAPGVISLIFGILSVLCLFLGCFTAGLLHWAAVPLALIGALLGLVGRGNLRVAGITLNLLALIPATILLLVFVGVLGLGALTIASLPDSRPSSLAPKAPPASTKVAPTSSEAAKARPNQPTTAELIEQYRRELRNPDAQRRRDGANGLGKLGPAAAIAVPELMETVKDKDSAVQLAAIDALVLMGAQAKRAVSALLQALLDPNEQIQMAALEALPKVGQPSKDDLAALIPALKAPNAPARLYVLTELLRLNLDPTELVPLLIVAFNDTDAAIQTAAGGALVKIGAPAVSVLVQEMETKEPSIAIAAAKVLGEIGTAAKPAQPALRRALKSPRADLRRAAAEALVRTVPDAMMVRFWLETLRDKELADVGLQALGLIGKAAVPGLAEVLSDKEPFLRSRAAEALGRIGPEAASSAAALIGLLRDDDADTRTRAGAALVSIRPASEELAKPFGTVLKDKNEACRVLAIATLAGIGWEAKVSVPLLSEALRDDSADVRSAAAQGLGKFGADAESAVPLLAACLKDLQVRQAAAEALGKIGPAAGKAVPALSKLIIDADKTIRPVALNALGAIDPTAKAARPALEIMAKFGPLNAKNTADAIHEFNVLKPEQRCDAFAFLGSMGDSSLPFLVAGLKDSDAQVHDKAIKAVSVPTLIKLLEERDVPLRTAVARGLGSKGSAAKEAAGPLLLALQDKYPAVRAAAEEALIGIGKPAVPVLVKGLKDSEASMRMRCARILGKIGPDAKDAIPALMAATKDPDTVVYTEAKIALTKIQR